MSWPKRLKKTASRVATATRRAVAPYWRSPVIAYSGLAIVVAILLWWAPTPAWRNAAMVLILVGLLIAGVEALRRQIIREFPDATREDANRRYRERWDNFVAGTRRLFVVDQFNYRLVTVDVESRKVVRSVRVGRNPFAVTLSPDERFAWVSNVGMFEYPLVPGVTRETRAERGLPFPAYGVPSKEAEEGVTVGGVRVPRLGSPNHPDAMSVFGVDLATGTVVHRIKTGYLVGVDRDDITTVGGASPGALLAGRDRVYVANATNDTISVIDS